MFFVLASGASAAYQSFVAITVDELTCCGGQHPSMIGGISQSNGIGISSSPDCSDMQAVVHGPAAIVAGQSYVSGLAVLGEGSQYYFCMRIGEVGHQIFRHRGHPYKTGNLDADCGSYHQSIGSVGQFYLGSVQCCTWQYCPHSNWGSIGSNTAQDVLVLPIPFTA